MTLDFSRCRLPPFQHQREDVAWLLERPYAFVASEMRTGKSKIVIDAAQFLYEAGVINKVIIVAPAPVRDVWYDPVLGELAKHLWLDLSATIAEYHTRIRVWKHGPDRPHSLEFYVTNYEFLRSKNRQMQLLAACGSKTILVLDESSFAKNWRALQTKACVRLRKACGRIILLNGTPIFHSPLDLFSQGNLLHPSVLNCPYVTQFKAQYAIMGPVLTASGRPLPNPRDPHGGPILNIVGWTNLEYLQKRLSPITVRRLQKDCLDLPPKLDAVALTATLTPETWRAYKAMRDDLVVWLKNGQVSTSTTAAIKVMRLSQITSGFLGGIEDTRIDNLDDLVPDDAPLSMHESNAGYLVKVGSEKLDILLWFIEQRLEADPNLHLVVWCRFRPELFRMMTTVRSKFPQFETGMIYGQQRRADRLRALALLKPDTSPSGPVFVGGIEGTGSFGLDMTAAHTCVSISSGYSPGRVSQTLDRVYGPGQKFPIAYFDIVAVSPTGAHTIDHTIITARRKGENLAAWTASAWVKALEET